MSTIVLEHLQHANSASPDLTVDSSGNIGIGTTTPSATLEINPASGSSELKITSTDNGGNNVRLIQGYNTYLNASNNVYMSAGGNTDMFNLVNGKVGIGTTSPGYNLQVNAPSNTAHFVSATRGGVMIGTTDGSGAYILLDGAANGDGAGGDYSYIEHDSTGKMNFNVGNSNNSVGVKMSIHPEGYVKLPYQPAFHVTGLSAHLYAHTGAGVITTWLTTNLNRGGHWNGSRWTVPVDGTYVIQFDPMYQHNGGDVTFQILVNGNQKAYNNPHTKDNGGYYPPWHNAPINWMGELSAGDYVEFSWSSGGSASTFIYSGGLYTRAWGYLLG